MDHKHIMYEIWSVSKKLQMAGNYDWFYDDIMIDGALTWKNHIDLLIKKLSKACYVIRNVKPYMSPSALKAIYYSFFHSLMSYGIIFWGNSSHSYTIFLLQKKAIRTMLGCGSRVSCRNIFKDLDILLLASQYIFSLSMFVLQNKTLALILLILVTKTKFVFTSS
jgi:hypothetical protein